MVSEEVGETHGTALRLFHGLAGSYDTAVDYATLFQDRYWKLWAMRRLGAGRGGFILDVGCGTLLLEERLTGSRRKFVGVDLSREMITVGREKRLRNTALMVNGDAESLPFPDASFGSVVSCYVAKYVRTSKFAEELGRVTRAGGVVALYDFARPRGVLAPFLGLYIQGGLRWAGLLLRFARRSSAYTYENLPAIIDGSSWDEEIVGAMENNGFRTIATERLTGGTVFAYCGQKGGSP
ncbi:MAG: class I SAM-dependent methyltransferase [Nitrososphaerota archaeon]|nr:class I SAM-dependent methyltransferase [Nitrososphaerota archaeon]MDG7023662.1 class I SAM-dependent methyltransferase [Nitrososphaerota archaeon]